MEFYDLLIGGGSTKSVAKSFLDKMMSAAIEAGDDWWAEVSSNFITQCFRSVGLKCTATAEQLKVSRSINWREGNTTYAFAYNAYYFQLIEKFFASVEHAVDLLEQDTRTAENDVSPVLCYTTVLLIWNEVCQDISHEHQQLVPTNDLFYLEPIARLNFFILKHLVKLEQKYVSKYPRIQNICLHISRPVRFGLYYKRTHKTILEGMLELMVEYRTLFFRDHISLWEFYYCALICEKKASSLAVFANLTQTMNRWAEEQLTVNDGTQYLRNLTNNLINEKMMNAYHGILNDYSTKVLPTACLEFLDVLQRNLVSLECFTKNFASILLLVAIDHDYASVRKKSAQLYATIAQKLQPNRVVLINILEVFLKSKRLRREDCDFHATFSNYLTDMMAVYPMMRNFKSYLAIIIKSTILNEVRMLAAHALVALINLYMPHAGSATFEGQEIVSFLKRLPDIMPRLERDKGAVLCGLFTQLDYEYLANKVENGKALLDCLEDCCLLLFYNDEHIELHHISNVYHSALRSMAVTNNFNKLKSVSADINDDFIEIEQELNRFQVRNEEPNKEVIAIYYYTLHRLNIMLQAKTVYDLDVSNIFVALRLRFLPKCMYKIEPTNLRLDYVAYEVIATAALILRDDVTTHDALLLHQTVTEMVEQFRALMLKAQQKDYELIKTLFTSIVLVHIGFAEPVPAASGQLLLTADTYSMLLGTLARLLQPCANALLQSTQDNMRHMLVVFQRLLVVNQLELPNATIWKLVVFYMLAKPFELELKEIVTLLLRKHTRNYVQAFPVVVYKLNVLKPALSEFKIKKALKAHLTLIDNTLPPHYGWCFKLHGYISTLEIVVKSVSLTSANQTQNRLLSLRYLMELIKNLRLSNEDFDNIDMIVRKLNNNDLNANEREILKRYSKELHNFKELCRKETVLASQSADKSDEAGTFITKALNGERLPLNELVLPAMSAHTDDRSAVVLDEDAGTDDEMNRLDDEQYNNDYSTTI